MMDFIYDEARPEHVAGKTISETQITDEHIEIKFTDGSELFMKILCGGYNSCRIDSTYYAPNLPGEEEA